MSIELTNGLTEMSQEEMKQTQGGEVCTLIVAGVAVVAGGAAVWKLGTTLGWWGGDSTAVRQQLPTRNFDPEFALEPLK